MQFPRTNKLLDKGCDALINAGSASVKLLDIAVRSIDNWDAHQQKQLEMDDKVFEQDLVRQALDLNKQAQELSAEYGPEAYKAAVDLVSKL